MHTLKHKAGKSLPSSRWKSYEGWDYNGRKQRLQDLMTSLNKNAFITHARQILSKDYTISEPFSAGQHWACFELVAKDGSLVIARARLPRHPDTPSTVTADDEVYAMTCEAATMEFLRLRSSTVPFPQLYAYAPPGCELATEASCAYMLIEGFYGNTLVDVQFDICQLPISQQEHIISQWTTVQAVLATTTFPQIGSICQISEKGEPIMGKLSSAPYDGLPNPGPFSDTASYFSAVAQGKLFKEFGQSGSGKDDSEFTDEDRWCKLGISVFLDLVQNSRLYDNETSRGPFHFNHMDLGAQNIIVDDDFKFLAIIDWEFAQTAPWEVNHYPMPFPLTFSPAKLESILANPDHIAFKNVSRQAIARQLYRQKFLHIEHHLQFAGRPLSKSIAETLDSPASRIYGCFEKLGVFHGQAEDLTSEMVRLGTVDSGLDVGQYLSKVSSTL